MDPLKPKNITCSFFLTSQDDKSQPSPSIDAMHQACEYYKNVILGTEKPWSENSSIWKTKLSLISKFTDSDNEYYFGAIGRYRDTTLPFIEKNIDGKNPVEKRIELDDSDEILERSYFIYYPKHDILVFHENHLGAKVSDLSYLFYKHLSVNIFYSPIWKTESIKSLLEDDSLLKKGCISIAVPRNFEATNFNLSNSWSKDILKMMSDNGMSNINLDFRGRAKIKKSEKSYINNSITKGIVELISKFPSGKNIKQKSKINEPIINAAHIRLAGQDQEINLLDEQVKYKMKVLARSGYPNENDIQKALVFAFNKNTAILKSYLKF